MAVESKNSLLIKLAVALNFRNFPVITKVECVRAIYPSVNPSGIDVPLPLKDALNQFFAC
jgi:hypothetical protein